MDKAGTLVLVGCVKRKQPQATSAERLYSSALFKKRAAFARAFGQKWLILSALHGVVEPEQKLVPYDVTLNTLGVKERPAWGQKVYDQLQPHLPGIERVVLLAGAKYAEFLEEPLERQGLMVLQPLHRVQGLGKQQAWLEQAVADGRWQT